MISNGLISGVVLASGSSSMPLETHVGPGLHRRSWWFCPWLRALPSPDLRRAGADCTSQPDVRKTGMAVANGLGTPAQQRSFVCATCKRYLTEWHPRHEFSRSWPLRPYF